MVTGTGRKPDVPRSTAQMARFDGEIMDLFSNWSPREQEEVSLLGRSWKVCSGFKKKTAFLLRPRQIEVTSLQPSHGSEPEPHSHSWDLRWFVLEALGQEECHMTSRMLILTSKLLKEPFNRLIDVFPYF